MEFGEREGMGKGRCRTDVKRELGSWCWEEEELGGRPLSSETRKGKGRNEAHRAQPNPPPTSPLASNERP